MEPTEFVVEGSSRNGKDKGTHYFEPDPGRGEVEMEKRGFRVSGLGFRAQGRKWRIKRRSIWQLKSKSKLCAFRGIRRLLWFLGVCLKGMKVMEATIGIRD